MKRPPLTRKRVEGLVLVVERIRPLFAARAGEGNLFRLGPDEKDKVRAALAFVADMQSYERERESKSRARRN